MQITISAKIVAAFVLGAVIAGSSVYFVAAHSLQTQIAKDQASREAVERRAEDAETQLSQLRSAVMQYQADRAAQMMQQSSAPASTGSSGLDALNFVRPGLGTVLQKAVPVINRAVQQWQASHTVQMQTPQTQTPDQAFDASQCKGVMDRVGTGEALDDVSLAVYKKCQQLPIGSY